MEFQQEILNLFLIIPLLRKLTRLIHFLMYFLLPWEASVRQAEQEEVRFALGESDNTHDLLVAETKAAVALQYTVAVRDKIIDAYKELMQMSI